MYNTKFALSIAAVLTVLHPSQLARAMTFDADAVLTPVLTDVTAEYEAQGLLEADVSLEAAPTPEPLLPAPGGDLPNPGTGGGVLPLPGDPGFGGGGSFGGGLGCIPGIDCPSYGGGFDFGTVLMLGEKIMNFIVTNKPVGEYKPLKAAVLPADATNFSQMKGWSKPVAKVYHVEFKNLLGKSAGGFDYRITFVYGGSFQGKGKYIGQISFVPLKMTLKTDRQLNVKAELLEPLNYGTEEDPLAGVQLQITWSSQTTLRHTMNSIEYFFYGNGDVQDISNGTNSGKLPIR